MKIKTTVPWITFGKGYKNMPSSIRDYCCHYEYKFVWRWRDWYFAIA